MRTAERAPQLPVVLSAPLLHWPERREMAAIDAERQRLAQRAATLPPASHRRIVLEGRICELTARLLAAEIAGRGR